MSRRNHKLQMWLLILVTLGNLAAVPLVAQEWLNEAKRGIVRVVPEQEEGTPEPGSGVIVHINEQRRGYIVTNYHVVEEAENIYVKMGDEVISVRKNPKRDRDLDLALLVTEGQLPEDATKLCLADEDEVMRAVNSHHKAIACGYPAGGEFAPFDGEINSSVGGHVLYSLRYGEQMKDGLSGGPLMSEGELILGINRKYKSGSNRAIKADIVYSFVQGYVSIHPPPTPDGMVGIWFARIKGDQDNMKQIGLMETVRRERENNYMIQDMVEVRDLEENICALRMDDPSLHIRACNLGERVRATIVGWGTLSQPPDQPSAGLMFSPRLSIVRTGRPLASHLRWKDIMFLELRTANLPSVPVTELESSTLGLSAKRLARFIIGYAYYSLDKDDKALREFEKLLDEYDKEKPENRQFVGELHVFCGTTRWKMSQRGSEVKKHLKKAIEHYQKARIYYESDDNIHNAQVENSLGLAYVNLPQSWYQYPPIRWIFRIKSNSQKAITHFGEAAGLYDKEGRAFDHACTQSNLSMSYIDSRKYTQAIEVCQDALVICKARLLFGIGLENQIALDNMEVSEILRREFKRNGVLLSPDTAVLIKEKGSEWLLIDKRMAGSEWLILDEGKGKIYSIERGEDKLDIYERSYPILYMKTKNNMGVAYRRLSGRKDREQNLRCAIEAYEDSLAIRRREFFPIGYAKVQYNWARAYTELPNGDRKRNLEKAVEAYQEALSIFEERSYRPNAEVVRRRLKKASRELKKFEGDN
jgi:tetratricopeptide (TPR) repeat protein